jgi:hypothetical protein
MSAAIYLLCVGFLHDRSEYRQNDYSARSLR